MTGDEIARVDLGHDEGVVVARQRTRDVAELLGFDRLDQTRIATAVSELARNAHRYATDGQVRLIRRRRPPEGRGERPRARASRTSTTSSTASTARRRAWGAGSSACGCSWTSS